MAISSDDLAATSFIDAPMAKAAAKGSAGASDGPRQDPRQPAGTKQASNPHLHKQHGFVDHKKPAGRK